MPVQQPIGHPQGPQLSPDQQHALKIHNDARDAASHKSGVHRPALVYDAQLTLHAEQWAKHLASDNKGLHHSTNEQRPGQGENLFWMSAGGNFAEASQGWVNEISSYHGEKIGEGNFGSYGHYTQIIWPSTTKVGLASAKSSNGGNFIVGRYSPPGNYTGNSAFTGK